MGSEVGLPGVQCQLNHLMAGCFLILKGVQYLQGLNEIMHADCWVKCGAHSADVILSISYCRYYLYTLVSYSLFRIKPKRMVLILYHSFMLYTEMSFFQPLQLSRGWAHHPERKGLMRQSVHERELQTSWKDFACPSHRQRGPFSNGVYSAHRKNDIIGSVLCVRK